MKEILKNEPVQVLNFIVGLLLLIAGYSLDKNFDSLQERFQRFDKQLDTTNQNVNQAITTINNQVAKNRELISERGERLARMEEQLKVLIKR
jgi:DNA anti-recombination protein RmuC